MSNRRRGVQPLSPDVHRAAVNLVLAISSLADTAGGIEALSVGSGEVIAALVGTEQYEHAAVLRALDALAVAVRRDVSAVMAHG